MKANELTIGDYVFNHRNWECLIVEIHKNSAVVIARHYGEEEFLLSELRPIPLTSEILEKNGFYYDEDRKAYLMGVIFQVKPERHDLFSFEICGCPYPLNTVHELQHALRLCGIEKKLIF